MKTNWNMLKIMGVNKIIICIDKWFSIIASCILVDFIKSETIVSSIVSNFIKEISCN